MPATTLRLPLASMLIAFSAMLPYVSSAASWADPAKVAGRLGLGH